MPRGLLSGVMVWHKGTLRRAGKGETGGFHRDTGCWVRPNHRGKARKPDRLDC